MTQVINLAKVRLLIATKKGYQNWLTHFKEEFGIKTKISQLSIKTLSFLAQGKDQSSFYLYELIMNIHNLGSGFLFNELRAKEKMRVIDQSLFILDLVRFECMKRLGWLEKYAGEQYTLVELISNFDQIAPNLQSCIPELSKGHPDYKVYSCMNTLDQETFIRKLIPQALKDVKEQCQE